MEEAEIREILSRMQERVLAERIRKVFHIQKRFGKRANCCGTLAYSIGKVKEFRDYAIELGLRDVLDIPENPDSYPGYISPRAGMKFLREDCYEVECPREGDVVMFWKSHAWSHSGVCVSNNHNNSVTDSEKKTREDTRRYMFHKDGEDSEFDISCIDSYFALSCLDNMSFHRVREDSEV